LWRPAFAKASAGKEGGELWLLKIKHCNVGIVAKNSSGLLQNKNSINKKVSKTRQFDARLAER
jgi:hypothetical protein